MGFIVIDSADDTKQLFVNFWNWRPTVELIRSFGIVDSERIHLLGTQCVGAAVSEDEARQISRRLQEQVLPSLCAGERVRLDGSVTSEPDDGRMHYGHDFHENYSATAEWLTKFGEFCSNCRGFKVL